MVRIRKFLESQAGFTLVELMIVVVIVGILAAVAVPMYRKNVKKAMASEGVALLGSVRTAQRVFHAEHGTYAGEASKDELMDQSDYNDNKYFDNFTITGEVTSTAFSASTSGIGDAEGITVTIDQDGEVTISGT
jgi:prepilin-type N-terminal cleavage/methylation domain-containing protein